MGHAAIAVILFVLQIIYISRVDWVGKAAKANTLCLKKHHRKSSQKQTTISLAVLSGSGLTKLESVNTVSGESQTEHVVLEVDAATMTVSETNPVNINLKRKLAKKALLFATFLIIFVASCLVKDLHEFKPAVMSALNRPMFSNWTFFEASTK